MNSRQACSVKMAGNWPFFFRDRPFNFRGGGGVQKQKQKIHTQENYENKIRLQGGTGKRSHKFHLLLGFVQQAC